MIKQQQGLTMIEILVAILILAIGLLGTASMQVRSVQDTGNSNLRSIAIYMANDMADRIRSNRAAMTNGDYNSVASAVLNANCMTTTNCTFTQMARHDMQQWLNNLDNALPGTDGDHGTISRNGDLFTIEVKWDERVELQNANIAEGSISLTFEP